MLTLFTPRINAIKVKKVVGGKKQVTCLAK